jgi:hypothetical protein
MEVAFHQFFRDFTTVFAKISSKLGMAVLPRLGGGPFCGILPLPRAVFFVSMVAAMEKKEVTGTPGRKKTCCAEPTVPVKGELPCVCDVEKSLCACEAPKTLCTCEPRGKAASGPLLGSVGMLRVTAKVDVGLGNWLTIRGRGAGLSWERGLPMKNEGPDRWTWEAFSFEGVEFKLLVNDERWECGDNHRCCCGTEAKITPQF